MGMAKARELRFLHAFRAAVPAAHLRELEGLPFRPRRQVLAIVPLLAFACAGNFCGWVSPFFERVFLTLLQKWDGHCPIPCARGRTCSRKACVGSPRRNTPRGA